MSDHISCCDSRLDFVDGWNWGKKGREGRVSSEYFDDNYADKEGDNSGKKTRTKNARTWRRTLGKT